MDGYTLAQVNECVTILVEEHLMCASPPGQVYSESWASGSVTLRGFEFLEAFRSDRNVDIALRQRAASRSRSDTILEGVRVLVQALTAVGPV